MCLILKCICGSTEYSEHKKNGIDIRVCKDCRFIHQKVDMTELEYDSFYKNSYHEDHQKELGLKSYSERYNHDLRIAALREKKYKDSISKGDKILDIGAGNGAFVDYMNGQGYDAYGLELCDKLGDKEKTYYGKLHNMSFDDKYWNAITMHDVLEHIIDIEGHLKECHRILSDEGVLIVDWPRFFVPEGKHHWRPIQHLWILSKSQCFSLFTRCGFKTERVDTPIASKLVFYLRK